MELTLGGVSREESTFFCPGTESRLSDEIPSAALAVQIHLRCFITLYTREDIFLILEEMQLLGSTSTS